jgi:hypothetical protein
MQLSCLCLCCLFVLCSDPSRRSSARERSGPRVRSGQSNSTAQGAHATAFFS